MKHVFPAATVLVAISFILIPSLIYSQTTGKIEGTIRDSETKEPIPGVHVAIEGTLIGNATNADGYYFILNVPVGLVSVKAQIIGYQSVTVKDVRVLADQTHTVDFTLRSTVIELPGQEVVGDREPIFVRDKTVSKERFTGETQLEIPADNYAQVIMLQAGVTKHGGSYNIRGGRSSENAVYVDGINIKNYTDDSANMNVGENAVEEVDVITGGFSSDFGDAQSGVINIVTREGTQDFTGQFRIETDEFMPKSSNYGFNRAQVSVGGPVPAIADNLTFFFSAEATGLGDKGPKVSGFHGRTEDVEWIARFFNHSQEAKDFLGHDLDLVAMLDEARVKNPDMPVLHLEDYRFDKGKYPNRKVNNIGDELRVQTKLAWQPTTKMKLTGTLMLDRDQGIAYSRGRMFWTELRHGVSRDVNRLGIVGYNHTLTQSAERMTSIQFRGSYQKTTLHSGGFYDLANPLGDNRYPDIGFLGIEQLLNFRPGNIPVFLEDVRGSDVRSLEDVLANYQYSFELPTSRGARNPFGLSAGGFFDTNTGYYNYVRNMYEARSNFRLDLDSQLSKVHRLRAGGDLKFWDIDRFENNLNSSTFLSFYVAEPEMESFYVEDRLDFQDLVVDLGFRVDSFKAGTLAPRVIGDQDPATSRAGGGVEPPRTTEVSPRLGVAHPVTDKTQIRMSYGSKFQIPAFVYLYDGINIDVGVQQNTNQFFGNPYLGFRKTTSFEVGMTKLLSENWVLDLVGYNRDIDGNISSRYIQQSEDMPYLRVYTNADNGNVKGFDLTLKKRFSRYYAMDIAYTMLFARSTGTDPEDFVQNEGFFVGGDRPPLPPVETTPNDFDQTHTFNYQFNVKLPGDFRPEEWLGKVLKNTGYYFTMHTNSGRPFTRQNVNFDFIEKSNASRIGWDFWADLRVVKDMHWKGLDYSVYLDIRNIFNNVNLSTRSASVFSSAGMTNGVYQTTGSPVTDGLTVRDAIDQLGLNDPSLYTGVRITDINGDGLFDERDTQEIISRIDFNGDGEASVEEELAMRIIQEGSRDWDPDSYDIPRQVRLGLEMRF